MILLAVLCSITAFSREIDGPGHSSSCNQQAVSSCKAENELGITTNLQQRKTLFDQITRQNAELNALSESLREQQKGVEILLKNAAASDSELIFLQNVAYKISDDPADLFLIEQLQIKILDLDWREVSPSSRVQLLKEKQIDWKSRIIALNKSISDIQSKIHDQKSLSSALQNEINRIDGNISIHAQRIQNSCKDTFCPEN